MTKHKKISAVIMSLIMTLTCLPAVNTGAAESYTYTVSSSDSGGYSAGDTIYSDSNIVISAADTITCSSSSETYYLKSSKNNTITTSSGNTLRLVFKLQVLKEADVSVITDVNSGKEVEICGTDESYTTQAYYKNEGTEKISGYSLTASLEAGTYYFGGIGTDAWVYGVDVAVNTDPCVTLAADAITVEEGQTDTVSISLESFANDASVNNLTFYAVFDPEVAEAVSVSLINSDGTYSTYDADSTYINSEITEAHLTIDDSGVYTQDDIGKTPFEAGKLKFAFYSSNITDDNFLYAFDSDVTVADITFKGVSAGTTSVSLVVEDCNSTPGSGETTSVSCTAVNGSVTVSKAKDITDAVKIMQYAKQYAEDSSSLTADEIAYADIDSSGTVDEKDAAELLKRLASDIN